MALLSGAQILIESLAREGTEAVFGYPGGVTLPIYDVLYDHSLRHVLVRHEQNAAFAAQGYARATGKAGVCMATSGPGATNLTTGSRHFRYFPVGDQAQLPGQGHRRTRPDDSRSLLHRHERASRPSAGRHYQGCVVGPGAVR